MSSAFVLGGADEEHHGVILRRPGREHAVIAVEVTAAHPVESCAHEPVASRLAAVVGDLTDDAKRRLAPLASERSGLAVSDLALTQHDLVDTRSFSAIRQVDLPAWVGPIEVERRGERPQSIVWCQVREAVRDGCGASAADSDLLPAKAGSCLAATRIGELAAPPSQQESSARLRSAWLKRG